MAYAIELLFDNESSEAIRQLWSDLSVTGGSSQMLKSGHPPHISIAGCAEIDFSRVDEIADFCSSNMAPLPIVLSHVAIFPGHEGVFFFGTTPNKQLREFHQKFHTVSEGILGQSVPYYLPDKWVPHCTLAIGLEDDRKVEFFRILRKWDLPRKVHLQQLAIVEHPGGVIKSSFELGGLDV